MIDETTVEPSMEVYKAFVQSSFTTLLNLCRNLLTHSFIYLYRAIVMSLTLSALACAASSFTNPVLFGAEIKSVTANLVTNFSGTSLEKYWYNHPTTVATEA